LTFTVNGDDAVEPDETFTIELFDSENAVIADKAGLVTIVNDDAPAPTVPAVSVSDASVQEGDKTNKTKVSVTISLSAATTDTVSVRLKTQDGTAWSGFDYVAADTAITFAPGETSKTYTLTVNGDKVADSTKPSTSCSPRPWGRPSPTASARSPSATTTARR
jgi:hypothetical protein